ncbi:MFS transporter [Nocardia altamirensis]|uniref:MFS transporter n=1 Tax=Nocardia altamirensis TaxID=472158 RepID=UPI000840400F|nr:MFS transporter [Nocardia altamirensis]
MTATQRWVLGVTAIASIMVALDLLIVSTALTTMQSDLQVSIGLLQWTVTAYGLSFAGLLMTGAALGDQFGRRRVFSIGLTVFALSSAGCALSPTIGWLIAARGVQGAGAALVMPLAVALLSSSFPAESRGRALGMFEGLTGLATIGGPLLGGILTHLVNWQAIFWVNVPIAAVLIVVVHRRVAESHGPGVALDVRGAVLVTAGVIGLVWTLIRGNDIGWTSPEILVAASVGVVLVLVFIGWQFRAATPMLPMNLFRSRDFSVGTVVGVLLFAALYGSVFFLAQLMQVGLGYTPLEAGIRLVVWTAPLLVIAPLAGLLAERVGDRSVLCTGLAINAVGLLWIALIASPDLSYLSLAVPLAVTGIGASLAIPVVQNVVLGAVAPSAIGKASGANSMTQEFGGAVGVALLVAVFSTLGGYTSPSFFLDGFAPAMVVCAALALAAAMVALAVTRKAHSDTASPDPAALRT